MNKQISLARTQAGLSQSEFAKALQIPPEPLKNGSKVGAHLPVPQKHLSELPLITLKSSEKASRTFRRRNKLWIKY